MKHLELDGLKSRPSKYLDFAVSESKLSKFLEVFTKISKYLGRDDRRRRQPTAE